MSTLHVNIHLETNSSISFSLTVVFYERPGDQYDQMTSTIGYSKNDHTQQQCRSTSNLVYSSIASYTCKMFCAKRDRDQGRSQRRGQRVNAPSLVRFVTFLVSTETWTKSRHFHRKHQIFLRGGVHALPISIPSMQGTSLLTPSTSWSSPIIALLAYFGLRP